MRRGGAWIVVAVLWLGCQAERIDVDSQPILGGVSAEPGQFPSVVGISHVARCTGTLVAPNLVLTASHCLSPTLWGFSSQAELTAATTVVFDTLDLKSGSGSPVPATETIINPGFVASTPGVNDIGLIRLPQPVLDREPTPINRIRDDAPIGTPVTQVGFGLTIRGDSNSSGPLNYLENERSVSCTTFGASDQNLMCYDQSDGTGRCNGDSGGPSLATINGVERVIGVTSFGDTPCAQFGADMRVDSQLDFLFAQAPELACQADGACNDECGQNGLPLDPECQPCSSDADCDDGRVCFASSCIAEPFSQGGLGSTCENDADCESGLCGMDASGGTCSMDCVDGSSCPGGFECLDAGGRRVCWPEEGGGCSSSGGTPPWFSILLVLAALAVLRGYSRNRRV